MKKIFAFAIACLAATLCMAQTQVSALIKEQNGNVGINLGAEVPNATLEVGGNVFARSSLSSSVANIDIGGHLNLENLAKSGAGVAQRWTLFNMGGAYGNSLQFWAYDATGCAGGLCAPRLVLMDNGNIGIGDSNPQAKLSVNGGIATTKIKVSQTLAWPDYVFEPTYQLPSLQELDRYIKTHKRLPDMPSAEEVAQNGIDLGQNQALLLKKIEELTLYVIELEKKIEQVQKAQ